MKFNKRHLFFIVSFSFIALLNACKEEIPVLPTISISDDYAAYTAFDSASYWIYERKLPEPAIDTLRIIHAWPERRYNTDATTNGYYYNAHDLHMSSKILGITMGEIAVSTQDDSIIMNGHYRIYFENSRYFSIFIPRYPFGEVQYLGINEGNYTNVALINNLLVNGKSYQDVYHTHIVDYMNAPDTAFLDFYLAKNHGLVKYQRSTLNNQSIELWELLSDELIPLER